MSDIGNLVITVKKGEAFNVGDDIRVEMVEFGWDQVRVRISAPKSLAILRDVHVREDSHEKGQVDIDP